MVQGPRREGAPRHLEKDNFRLFNCHLYREPNYGYTSIRNTLPYVHGRWVMGVAYYVRHYQLHIYKRMAFHTCRL